MADDDIKINNGQVDDTQVDDSQTEDNETKTQSDSEFVDETLSFIKETQKTILGEDDTDVDGGQDDDDDDDDYVIPGLENTNIPDEYTEACEAAGISKKDIVKYANKHTNEELIEEARSINERLKQLDNEDGTKGDDKVTKQGSEKDKEGDNKDTEVDPKLIENITEKISKELAEKFGTTLEKINEFESHQKEQSTKQTVETASKIFDEASKEFPVFGKTDELQRFTSGRLKGQLITTSPEMKARLEVLSYADVFMSKGESIDDAMTKALATYKGLHLEKELERKQIRDLKQHEKKLSGARVGRETKKKHADTRDEIIDDIKQMQRAAGID